MALGPHPQPAEKAGRGRKGGLPRPSHTPPLSFAPRGRGHKISRGPMKRSLRTSCPQAPLPCRGRPSHVHAGGSAEAGPALAGAGTVPEAGASGCHQEIPCAQHEQSSVQREQSRDPAGGISAGYAQQVRRLGCVTPCNQRSFTPGLPHGARTHHPRPETFTPLRPRPTKYS